MRRDLGANHLKLKRIRKHIDDDVQIRFGVVAICLVQSKSLIDAQHVTKPMPLTPLKTLAQSLLPSVVDDIDRAFQTHCQNRIVRQGRLIMGAVFLCNVLWWPLDWYVYAPMSSDIVSYAHRAGLLGPGAQEN